jgi:hypothetical protein
VHASVILPVWGGDGMVHEDRDPAELALLDLIAFEPHLPQGWTVRSGLARCLGRDPGGGSFGDWIYPGEPLLVPPHPLAWLQRGCIGVLPLAPDGWAALAARSDLVLRVETIAEGKLLEAALAAARPLPQIVLPDDARSAAA